MTTVCTRLPGVIYLQVRNSGKRKPALSYCSKHGDKRSSGFVRNTRRCSVLHANVSNHRKCQVMSVSDMKSSAHGQSLDDVINSLLSLKCRIGELKSDREKSAEDLVNFKTSCKERHTNSLSRVL